MAPDSTPVLPQYPELILAAIEDIGSKKGANKSEISRKIQSIYGTLPAAHATLLSHHLNRMKATGQLLFVQNNYVKPDPNTPPKRGRGRPAKPKKPVPEGTVKSPPRPRGRPAKPWDGSKPVVATPTVSGEKRGRGRPPKPGKKVAAAPVLLPSGERRGRGRPPNVNSPWDGSKPVAATPAVSGEKRGRGRPPKPGKKVAAAPVLLPSGERRGRGRPPKVNSPVSAAPVEA